jgi:hypothetical protein
MTVKEWQARMKGCQSLSSSSTGRTKLLCMDALGKAASMPTLARQVSPATGTAVPIVRVVNLVPLQEQRPLTPWEGVNFLLMFPRDPNLVAGRRPNSS